LSLLLLHSMIWNDRMINRKKIIVVCTLSLIFLFLSIIAYFRINQSVTELSIVPKPNIPQSTIFISPFPTNTITPTITIIPTNTIIPTQTTQNKILFGIGSQAGPAMDFQLVKEAPVHMLTSWYNSAKDLEWMRVQQNDSIPRLYANHYVVHLITWTDLPEETIETPHGSACGRPYPVSTEIVEDMKQLAQIYNGNGPMYVSLFTEFPSYTCVDNNWKGNENYWLTLKDNYRKIKDVFHQYAPQSKVGISWGGWLNRYDDVENQGGRSLIPYFADIMKESDFIAFQTMESDTNVQDILNMTSILGMYNKPVMISHYKPSSGSNDVFDSDMKKLFTDEMMQKLINNGLFAFSFMDEEMINKSETSYQLVKSGIAKYGK
jgi:hypothetical protein